MVQVKQTRKSKPAKKSRTKKSRTKTSCAKTSVDVRSPADVKDLERNIDNGPITIVLIYADWCGHCTRFKEEVWSKLLSKPRRVNLASIHHDQLSNTSLRDAKIAGYPSVLVVGKDGKPAVFKPEETGEPTNAMPRPDLHTLETIADADVGAMTQDPSVNTSVNRKGPMTPPDTNSDILKNETLTTVEEHTHNRELTGPILSTLEKIAGTNASSILRTKSKIPVPPNSKKNILRGNLLNTLAKFAK